VREGVGDVVLSRNVSDVCRELGDKVEMVGTVNIPLLLEGVGDSLVVDEDGEVARFQHLPEIFYGFVDGQ
jgi:hypothetical protein